MSPLDRPLVGTDSWRRLATLAERDPDELAALIDTTNLIPFYPGPSPTNPKHDRTPAPATARAYGEVLKRLIAKTPRTRRPNTILIAGRWTANHYASDTRALPYFVPRPTPLTPLTFVVPHPGGTNIQLNSPGLRAAYTEFLKPILKHATPTTETIHTAYLNMLKANDLRTV
jgi:hypothetical protein